MKRWAWMSAVVMIALVILSGCGKDKYPPVAINEDVDRCEICNMAIKDDAYATQIITSEGRSLKFDDLGCLNQWRVENGTDKIAATYVRDYNSLEWVKYDKAYYVYDASIQTPMAYGILSFEQQADAESYIQEHGAGTLLTAGELATHTWAVNKDMMGGSHDHDDSHSHDAAGEEGGHGDSAHEGGHNDANSAGEDEHSEASHS